MASRPAAVSRQREAGSGGPEAGRRRLPLWHTALLAVPALATVACLAAGVRFLLWSSSRGLDITDEGFYFVGASHPGDLAMAVTSSHFLLSPLFALVGGNVATYRLVGFTFTVLMAFVLAAGLDACRRTLQPDAPRHWTYVAAEAAAIAAGSLLGYAFLTASPSYNWITSWGLTFGAAALLVALAIGEASRAASIWLGLLGVSLAAVFFAKFTAAVAGGALFAVVLGAWPLAPFRVRLRWLAAAAAGFAIAGGLYFVVLQSPGAWYRAFRLGLWATATQSPLHSSGALTRYYVEWRDDVVVAWLKEFGPVFYALTALAIAIRFVPAGRWSGTTLRLFAWAGLAYAAYLSAIHVRDYPPSLYAYDIVRLFFGWLLLLAPLALAWRGRRSEHAGSEDPAYVDPIQAVAPGDAGPTFRSGDANAAVAWTLIVMMLFALPFCATVGTGNSLQSGMRFVMGPWFALFAVMLAQMSAPPRARWALPTGLAVLSALSLVYVMRGPLEAPYRLLAGLRGQTEETAVGAGGGTLKLDPELHAFITRVRQAALESGFRPGDDLLGFFDMPGIVFALGGRSPGLAWYTMGYPGSRAVAERGLALAGPERLRRAYILQTTASTEWLRSLKPLGIDFPGGYVPGGTFTIPYSWAKEDVTWWRPRSR